MKKITLKDLAEYLDVSIQMARKYRRDDLIIYGDFGVIDLEETKKNIEKKVNQNHSAKNREQKAAKRNSVKIENGALKLNISKDNEEKKNIVKNESKKEAYESQENELNSDPEIITKIQNGEATFSEITQANINDLRTIDLAEKIRKQKIDNDERIGKLIDIEKVKASYEFIGKQLKEAFESLPDTVKYELAEESDPEKIAIILKKEIEENFKKFHDLASKNAN